ncbi:MucBP domain-containing protein [Levilactobacillus senmaizukei]|uniref:MucBP domain-containing protein n=1 Tax=Levilactobacillus senmaizukei TaxID=431273 RepID=UPI00138F9C70|nr:MucBP domain-containing protein [Levilactobacillus senmaizukei]
MQKLFIGYYGGENGESTYNPDGKQYRLDGLEYATNLEVLMMGGGGQDAEPYHNFGNIEDISPLRNLRKLKTVYLSHNRISDVSPLAGLTNISDLKLHDNRITDFSSLKNLSVKVNEERIHQYVILDPIRVNSLTRKVHLDIPVRLQTGELLTGVNQNLEYTFSVPYYTGDSEYGDGKLVYAWYFQGGQVTDNGSGGLDFTHIVDQTEGGQFDESIQMDDNNYLIAEYVKDHYSFWIIQKYYIGDAAESVTVNYQDEQGHKLAATQILQGDIGDTYQAETVTIPGYELTKVPDNAQGTFGEEAITVTYVYRKLAPEPPVTPPTPNPQPAPNPTPTPGPTPILPPIKQGRVTVHYQTVAGMPVHGDTSVTGQVGQAYETRPLSLAGYHVVGRSTTATGIFGEQPVDVTYTYAANVVTGGQGDGTESEEPAVSTGNETSAGSGQISQPTATLPIHTGSAFATAMKPGEQPVALPVTNERATPFRWLGWLGWVVLVAGLGGWWFKRRRQ